MRDRRDRPEPPKPAGFGQNEMVPRPPASPIDWWKLDRIERAETLHVLADWVLEFVRRYSLTDQVVPPCWFQHEPLIQELLGLYQVRQQSQFVETAPPIGPNEFHKELYSFKHRVRELVSSWGCNAATHYETSLPAWVSDDTRVALWKTDVDEFIDTQITDGWPEWASTETEEEE